MDKPSDPSHAPPGSARIVRGAAKRGSNANK